MPVTGRLQPRMTSDNITAISSFWSAPTERADSAIRSERTIAVGASCLVFAAAFLLRMIPVFLWPANAHPDEIIQATEQGHRLVFGYGLIPWEFEYAARSWIIPYITAAFIWVATLFGDGPEFYLPAIGIGLGALAAVSVLCAFLWGRRFFGLTGGLVAALVPAAWISAPLPMNSSDLKSA